MNRDALPGEDRQPGGIRTKMRPAGAAQRKNGRRAVEALPLGAGDELHAQRVKPAQPGAQQRRGLHLLGEDAARGTDEGLDAEAIGPGDERIGREGADGRLEEPLRLTITFEKGVERLGVGQVQPAAACQQELARRCGHVIIDGDLVARRRQHFRRHEARGARSDDLDLCHAHTPGSSGLSPGWGGDARGFARWCALRCCHPGPKKTVPSERK